MCELFGVSSAKKLPLNTLLQTFFSHGVEHPHGWGMALFYGNAVSLEKQPEATYKSLYLKQRMHAKIEADNMIAHIRLATRGSMDYENTHPFVQRDLSDRTWTLAHNGTIFESDALKPFVHTQQGQTDSERILCYLIHQINERTEEKQAPLTKEERFQVLDELVCNVSPENKLNLLIFDGTCMYVHTNYENSLHYCRKEEGIVFSTRPLDFDDWKRVPMNTLLVYEAGKLVYSGINHGNEFFDSEEKMRLLFLDYAGL